ncbi:MAG: ArsI/CadI family heavy metal resistance metalloenzyme [Gammaproteobacteria bacterium]|nr:ArsI/CadI family heavy metal resistance metalloenzyme [Gammaproteobacteria bacterium]
MSRIHIALNTNHFEESIAFYSKLFNQEPAKVKPDWAKFDLQDPALNLTLNRSREPLARGDISHLGIEMEDSASVTTMDKHLRAQGLKTRVEENVTCCYALQDKTWVQDPNGHSWEFFFVKD